MTQEPSVGFRLDDSVTELEPASQAANQRRQTCGLSKGPTAWTQGASDVARGVAKAAVVMATHIEIVEIRTSDIASDGTRKISCGSGYKSHRCCRCGMKRKIRMINLTRLDHSSIVLNCELIEYLENTPDTVVTLTSDRKIRVLETTEEIVELVRVWRSSLRSDRTDLRTESPYLRLSQAPV